MSEPPYERPKHIAVRVEGGELHVRDSTFNGFDVALSGRRLTAFTANKATFNDVAMPMDIEAFGDADVRNTNISHDPKIRDTSLGRAVSGWREVKGPPLPSYCSKCGNVFASQNYSFAGPYWTLWNNRDTCFICGNEKAELSEGHFDLTKETVKVLLAPDITREMVARLEEISRKALYGELRPATVVAMAEKIHPTFGRLVKRHVSKRLQTIGILIAAAGAVVGLHDFGTIIGVVSDDIVTQKALDETLERHRELWQERLQPREIFSDPEQVETHEQKGAAPSKYKTLDGAATKILKTDRHPKKRGADREKLLTHRKSFGGSRSR